MNKAAYEKWFETLIHTLEDTTDKRGNTVYLEGYEGESSVGGFTPEGKEKLKQEIEKFISDLDSTNVFLNSFFSEEKTK